MSRKIDWEALAQVAVLILLVVVVLEAIGVVPV